MVAEAGACRLQLTLEHFCSVLLHPNSHLASVCRRYIFLARVLLYLLVFKGGKMSQLGTKKKDKPNSANPRNSFRPSLALALKLNEARIQQSAMRGRLYAELRRLLYGSEDDEAQAE